MVNAVIVVLLVVGQGVEDELSVMKMKIQTLPVQSSLLCMSRQPKRSGD